MPVATRPAVSPASDTPTPPGIGSTPAKTVTTVLISTASAMPDVGAGGRRGRREGQAVEDLGERVAADHHGHLRRAIAATAGPPAPGRRPGAPCCGASAPPAPRSRPPPGRRATSSTSVAASPSSSPSALGEPEVERAEAEPADDQQQADLHDEVGRGVDRARPRPRCPTEPPTRWKNRIITARRPTALGTARPM